MTDQQGSGIGRALLAVIALAAAIAFGFAWTFAPAPTPLDAPPGEFSSARARIHLETIARRPHRIGSAEHAAVRAYLVAQLRALGLEPEIQETVAAATQYRPPVLATVRNVVARRAGTGTERGAGKALLLMAHYDSRAMTPGASDDGYGVATLLETARALQAGGPTASAVIFLFTDGEEEGLLGARAFVAEHRWAADVGVALNFEARGNEGPALMFQTGDGNGALIRALARAAPHPAASSLSQAIYRRMPNDTDLSTLLPLTPSLNFANIGGFERYHAPTDTVANADLRTLQHHGESALALARNFAAGPLPPVPEADAVYFNAGPFFVHYPGALDRPLAILAAILVVAFVVTGHRRSVVRPLFAAGATVAVVALVLTAAVACGVGWSVTARLHPDYRLLNAMSPTLKGLYVASFLALATALGLGFHRVLQSRLRGGEVFAGGAAVFAMLAVLAATYLPGASFLFTWPLLLALPIAIGTLHAGADPFRPQTLAEVAAAIALSMPPLVLLTPFLPQLVSAFGLAAAPAVGGLAALLAAFAAPAARLVLQPSPRLVPLAAAAIAVACYLGAGLADPFDRDHPRPDTLVFAVDGDSGRAWWLSPDPTPDAWTAPALAGAAARPSAPLPFPLDGALLVAPAQPSTVEPGPSVNWLTAPATSVGAEVRLRVDAPVGTELLAVHIDGLLWARVLDHPVPLQGGALDLRFFAPPPGGVPIAVGAASAAPLSVRAVSQRSGFPAHATPSVGDRPPELMAKPGMMPPWNALLESDHTLVAVSATR